jgi:oxaloacetate decarboxylase alpha subunit
MADISLVDVSLRDGNQSLWGATGVTNRLAASVAPAISRVGYRAIEMFTSTTMATTVRYGGEDPWQRIRAVRAAAPDLTLGFLTTGKRFITFGRTPDNLFELAFDLLRRNGVTRLWVIDPMHNMQDAIRTAEMAKRVGFEEVVGGLCYSISPVHTDEYYLAKIAELDASDAIDSVYFKDPAGLLTPERVRDLVPRLRARLTRTPFREMHTHASTGLAPVTLLEAADQGMDILHTALPPLAYGNSHSSGIRVAENLRARGHTVDVDVDAMREASAILTRHAKLHRLPAGVPAEYEESYYRHNIPGGVMSTLKRQLAEIGKQDLLPAVIEESVHVRRDLGWPIVVTPFAQYIVTQATLNIISGERYAQISDEVVDLLLGDFGPLPGDVDQGLLDRAQDTSRARRRGDQVPEPPSLGDLRERFGRDISDEDLLLRAVMPSAQVDAMVAKRDAGPSHRLRDVLAAFDAGPKLTSFSFTAGDTSVSVTRKAAS